MSSVLRPYTPRPRARHTRCVSAGPLTRTQVTLKGETALKKLSKSRNDAAPAVFTVSLSGNPTY